MGSRFDSERPKIRKTGWGKNWGNHRTCWWLMNENPSACKRGFGDEKSVCSMNSQTPYTRADTGAERNWSGAFGRFGERWLIFRVLSVTDDETWVFHWDPPIKQKSIQWVYKGSTLHPQKSRKPSLGLENWWRPFFGTVRAFCLLNTRQKGPWLMLTFMEPRLNTWRRPLKQNYRTHDEQKLRCCTTLDHLNGT